MLQFTMDEQTESEISCRAEQISDSSPLSGYALNGAKSLSSSLQVKRMTRYTCVTPGMPITCSNTCEQPPEGRAGGKAPALRWGQRRASSRHCLFLPSRSSYGVREGDTVKPRLDCAPNVEPELCLWLAPLWLAQTLSACIGASYTPFWYEHIRRKRFSLSISRVFFQAPPGTLRVPRRIHYLEHMRV